MRHFINAQFINSRADNTMGQNRALFLLYGCMEKDIPPHIKNYRGFHRWFIVVLLLICSWASYDFGMCFVREPMNLSTYESMSP